MNASLTSTCAAFLLALFAAGPLHAQDTSHGHSAVELTTEVIGFVPGADRLEGRIRAPCCWNQTLDIHNSEVSNGLRREIRQRLRSGETPEVIEADIVARYGERVLAVPAKSPLKTLAIGLSAAMGLAGVGAAFMVLRWRRRTSEGRAAEDPAAPVVRDELDERIDKELENQG